MDERDSKLILEFKHMITPEVAKHVRRLIVFGSRVRGEAAEDSDLDLIVLLDKRTRLLEEQLGDYTYQVMWAHDFKPIISLKVFEESQYTEALSKGFSFYRHVEAEGVAG